MGDQQVEKHLLPMMSDNKKDADGKTFGNASLKVNNFIFISCDLNPVKKTKITNSGTTLICRPCWRRPCPCWPSATPSLSSSSAGLLSSPSIWLVSICRWVSFLIYWIGGRFRLVRMNKIPIFLAPMPNKPISLIRLCQVRLDPAKERTRYLTNCKFGRRRLALFQFKTFYISYFVQ